MALNRERVAERMRLLRRPDDPTAENPTYELSQEAAAHKAGVTTRQWQRWEAGESMPYPRNLGEVADRFGIEVSDFFEPVAPVEEQVPIHTVLELQAEVAQLSEKLDRALSLLDGIAPQLHGLDAVRDYVRSITPDEAVSVDEGHEPKPEEPSGPRKVEEQ